MSHRVATDCGLRSRWPVERVSGKKHVPDESFDWGLAHKPDEEKLLYHGGGDGSEGGQSKKQLSESGRLVGVLSAAVFLKGALRLLLQLFHNTGVSEADGIWRENEK